MSIDSKVEPIPPLTLMPRRFVHHILNFFVGLGIGLAPFLGNKKVPGFRALISVMPFQITSGLITISAVLMGVIVVAVQFYSAERISRPLLRKLFGIALTALIVGFVLFYHLRIQYTVDVERGKSGQTVTVLIGALPRKGCACPNAEQNPEECIRRLSFSSAAIASCWDRREISARGELLGLSYLTLTGGVGVLIGFLLLQEELRRAAKNKQAQKQGPKKNRQAGTTPKKARAAKGASMGPEPSSRDADNPEAGSEPPGPAVLP